MEKESSKMPNQIVKLDEAVVNRIAAGEVIQRPANALKELMENSLDAEAMNLNITIKSGGMKLLQIQDDGSGIRTEDLSICCERFTTSKLRTFEDLQQIGTYGFRGEALASISHVAHLSIITKTSDSQCAYRAEYTDGKLKEYPSDSGIKNPKPCAGKQGTSIIVEDLFYNMESRRKALCNTSEEHSRIVEVVTRYAVHNAQVGFSLKKFGETLTELRTPSKSSVLDNIRILYGPAIARELIEVSCEDISAKFKMSGYASNVNYSTKKFMCILFINNRLIDSTAIRKSVEAIYSNFLPKGMHPFVYLSIMIDPRNVDVNVHPTKHEVHFLHEDVIVGSIASSIENILLGANESRTYFIQALLPGASATPGVSPSVKKRKETSTLSETLMKLNEPKSSSSESPQARNMIRTDPKLQKLDKFLSSTPNPNISSVKEFSDSQSKLCAPGENVLVESSCSDPTFLNSKSKNNNKENDQSRPASSRPGTSALPKRREIKLKSVKVMKEAITADCHETLLTLFRNHTFVGCVDRSLALFQHETSLYVCSTARISTELFYQKMIFEFGNFGKILIDDPIAIKDLAAGALETEPNEWLTEDESKDYVIEQTHKLLMSKRKMLEDYFSLAFNAQGCLTGIPLLLENYFPNMEGLPAYIMNLAQKVDWKNEQRCFETFCHQTAIFYSIPPGEDQENMEIAMNGHTWKWNIEHIIFPEVKKSLLPPKVFADDSTIVLLTTLPELYKVFERC